MIIADDGSGKQTSTLIREWAHKLPFRLLHVWHEDNGFRKSNIVNAAVLQSQGDLLVFSDQDCLVPEHFIQDHVSSLEHCDFVIGSRRWIPRKQAEHLLDSARVSSDIFRCAAKPNPFIQIYEYVLQSCFRSFSAIGCNIAVRRSCFFAINGFNEDLKGYGCEDSDLGYRLLRAGYKCSWEYRKNFVYHLWHKRNGHLPFLHKGSLQFSKQRLLRQLKTRCDAGLYKSVST